MIDFDWPQVCLLKTNIGQPRKKFRSHRLNPEQGWGKLGSRYFDNCISNCPLLMKNLRNNKDKVLIFDLIFISPWYKRDVHYHKLMDFAEATILCLTLDGSLLHVVQLFLIMDTTWSIIPTHKYLRVGLIS